ncbi:hypothetical protein OBBRIDRAFT_859612 [Obba rivulosa]|uniref:Uncharacterized protein n=1 Tax=Obba rivulosa TaxID=1052685 RepID=A0A8E2DPL8_9APHY|nr:hypothetical protein OBBRIDRAFT_859612 [Obba rivulosa]
MQLHSRRPRRFGGRGSSRPALLHDDFDTVYNNLEQLMGQVQQLTKKHQGLLSSENGLRRIQFRHAIFEPLTEGNAYTAEELALPREVRIEGWPVSTAAVRTALNSMRRHTVYDMHGVLIPPSEYMTRLRGAVTIVRFNLAAYTFGQLPDHRHMLWRTLHIYACWSPHCSHHSCLFSVVECACA